MWAEKNNRAIKSFTARLKGVLGDKSDKVLIRKQPLYFA